MVSERVERPAPPGRAGLRLQLGVALGALTLLAFVPLYFAVASLTWHTLRTNREELARALGRAVAGRLSDDLANGRTDEALRDVARVSIDESAGGDGVAAIRVLPPAPRAPIEIGAPRALSVLRARAPTEVGEHATLAVAPGAGPLLAIDVVRGSATVQVALRVGDQASRAAPLLRLVAFYTFAFALVLVVFAYLLLGRLIVRPIGALVAATRRIGEAGPASGRRLEVAPIAGAAEVVELGQAIARTTGLLVEREEALAGKVAQLEAARADLLTARDAIVRGERLASVGRLSAGLAHEVGNPIAALLGLEEVLLGGELDDETRDLVERMKRETERVHHVMRDLLDFARAERDAGTPEPLASASVREVADEVAALVRPQRAMRDVSLDVDVPADVRAVRLAGSRLQQVLLNLVLNAADALGERAPAAAPGRITIRARPLDEHTVRVEVEDDGPGVPASVRDKLFEPFVTTKDVGKGTGLGLAVCRGLVEGAGGCIDLATDGPGARFVVDLPTLDAPAKPPSHARSTA